MISYVTRFPHLVFMSKKKSSKIEIKVESDKELKKLIGGKLKRIRRRRDRTARWVAEQSGISRIGLTQIENGRNNITAILLWKIANVLRCDIKEFFPAVPDSTSLSQSDLDTIALEDKQAAEFAKKAFKKDVSK